MHKKKILSGAAVVLGLSLVGGSLAWFTDSSSVSNNFKALNVKAEIVEDFDKLGAKQMVPGDTITKDVDIKVNSSAETFVRVKVTKGWKNGESIDMPLADDNLQLDYSKSDGTSVVSNNIVEGKWFKDGDYLYYIGAVKQGDVLDLLDSVTFVPTDENTSDYENSDNKYQDKEMYVNVELEAIQAKNNAFITGWGINESSDLGQKLAKLSTNIDNIK